jgi:hypothetical protein
MSSEATFEVVPMVGNTDVGQRGSGHSAVSESSTRIQTQSWISCGVEIGTRVQANHADSGCMCAST